jgi:ribose transport system substrate-binding protein
MVNKIKVDKKYNVISIAVVSSIAVGIAIIIIGMMYYKSRISELGMTDTTNYLEYKYHYALISEETDTTLWDAIYQGSLDKGKETNVYVDRVGSNLTIDYSLEDLMSIAIASRVDGIILEPNNDEKIFYLINKAEDAGIPVITVIKDLPLSKRTSFVGINSYSEGQIYAKMVENLIDEGKSNITILLNSDNKDPNQDSIYSSILEIAGKRKVDANSVIINAENTFRSAEVIRKIIVDKDSPPDILVCLSAADTLSAYQVVVDYNKVGEIEIIGYYNSDIILQAIKKNIIYSTMTIDAKQMGSFCVEALTEYLETNNVSDYHPVDISEITSDNVEVYLNEHLENSDKNK